jgi:hypothetical protein
MVVALLVHADLLAHAGQRVAGVGVGERVIAEDVGGDHTEALVPKASKKGHDTIS